MMDQMIDCCEGVIGIADDIVVHGKDDAEHNRQLHHLMQVAREHGLVFNRDKCEVKATSVTFFGTVYDKDGAHPDPKKVEAIHKMPPPEGTTGAPEVSGDDHIPITLHPLALNPHRTPERTTQEGLRVHMEQLLWRSLRQGQADGLQGYDTSIL